ncbi:MAG: GNAT family N-acetyltransferase [Sulfurovaceae bacterium]|nr:GNAT family N-acetyltransferase [Sulfurovaceae bacterium]
MRKIICETKRLKIVTVEDSDIEFLYQDCFSDWEVMKLLLGKTFTLEETKVYVEKNFTKGQLLGFTVVFEKENNELIGYAGMFHYPFNGKDNEYEFGYILKQKAWGKGYATELSFEQIAMLKKHFVGASIIATAHPKNLASKRILEKVGMELVEASIELENRGLRDVYKLK